jgi:hypothetical protein
MPKKNSRRSRGVTNIFLPTNFFEDPIFLIKKKSPEIVGMWKNTIHLLYQ